MFEQSIEIGAFVQGKILFEKTLLKITLKHHLSEMYLNEMHRWFGSNPAGTV